MILVTCKIDAHPRSWTLPLMRRSKVHPFGQPGMCPGPGDVFGADPVRPPCRQSGHWPLSRRPGSFAIIRSGQAPRSPHHLLNGDMLISLWRGLYLAKGIWQAWEDQRPGPARRQGGGLMPLDELHSETAAIATQACGGDGVMPRPPEACQDR